MAEHGRRPAGGKPSGGKPSDGKPAGGKSSGSRPSSGRPSGGRPGSGKPASKSGGKPGSSRPASRDGKPGTGKPGDKPRSGGRPTSKPGERSAKPYGDRPARSTDGSRPPARSGKPGEKPRSGGRPAGKPGTGRPGERSAKPYGDKPRSGGRPTGKPGDRRDDRGPRRDGGRPDTRSSGPRSASRDDRADRPRDPHLADDILASDLDRGTLNELRTLPDPLAELIARHLVAAERALIEDDTKKALEHIEAARRRASRIAAVREAAGVANYRAGNYAEALAELRAAKRMTGSPAFTPMMADCERGLGRPQKALDLLRVLDPKSVDVETRVEGLIVAAGARADMGNTDAAVVTLQVPELTRLKPGTPRARLQYAYAEFLLAAGRLNEANEWMQRAAGSDIDGATDADERADEFAGIALGTEGE